MYNPAGPLIGALFTCVPLLLLTGLHAYAAITSIKERYERHLT